ncbi:hypothetical protein ZYGR_0AV01440 [Zygosaccharomyces rouxii]|uniref:USP domain-containing protein n=1 Tax=Zygosaccharomyces rouxii TaxID=4956 RepID=A0A1Q3AIR1_ZYGRO|nr:hypothetical protein ZYGR_0AV01440 [Zygosaccharomyces rouxii]
MNNWKPSLTDFLDLTEHLKKPFYRHDSREKEVSKVVFDDLSNLIWVGDSYARVSSYYGGSLSLYSRYTANIGGLPVNDILTHREGILSLNEDSLHFANRRGVTMMNLTSVDVAAFSDLRSMCFGGAEYANDVYCAGTNPNSGIVRIDLNRGTPSSVISYPHKVKLMRSNNKVISVGKQTGGVDILDPRSNSVVRTFSAHSGTVSSMDARDYTLVTVGKSKRFNNMYADPFVNVYDLRTMQQLPPISFSKGTTMGAGGADFVQLHSLLPTVMVVGSASGSFDFVDLANPTLRTQYIHPSQSIKSMTLSPNGDYLAFIGDDNTLTTWNRTDDSHNFTNTPIPLEYPDFVDDGLLPDLTDVDDQSYPLSSVGMPYYSQQLISAWPNSIFRSPGTIATSVDEHMPITKPRPKSNPGAYPLQKYDRSKYGRRNALEPYECLKEIRKKFASGIIPSDMLKYKSTEECEVPRAYMKLPLTHGRYGTDNFDFQAFNQTSYSTLDNDVDNVYTNSILQLYRFVPELFNFVVGSLKDENFGLHSLLTELGYLYDMMDRSKGKVCRSANFQSTLNSIDGFKEQGLTTLLITDLTFLERLKIDDEPTTAPIMERLRKSLVQKFNEFLLYRLMDEESEKVPPTVTLKELYGFQLDSIIRTSCNYQEVLKSVEPTLTVLSPTRNSLKYANKKMNNQTILPYIESSMRRVKHTTSICSRCNKQELTTYERTMRNLPPVLSLDILLSESEWAVVKSVKNWLSKEFFAAMTKEKALLQSAPQELRGISPIFKYELNGYVARISDRNGESRLVTFIRKYESQENIFKWYMFNGYLAVEVDEEEALNISYWWKTPETIIYCDAEEIRKPFFSVDTYRINYDVLYRNHFANGVGDTAKTQYELLCKEEAPKPGTLVAIDAEFVVLSEELSDIDCNGAKTIVKPKKTALARLSVLRCEEGAQFGVPFIDDYIFNKEHIENYLTRYSGISPGDLDLEKSDKPLVSREVTYRKVWLLMQLGCVFVGHGLSNDFKHININVPKEQIRDTALYFLRGKRFLSLRYLAYALLDKNVQEGNHDSIEDAYTALILYKKYLDLKEKGTLEHVLDTIYAEGRASNYRVPFQ